MQKFFKKLRFNGFPLRYFVTGEYGEKKGRAHWHVMVYWLKRVPEHVLDQNFIERHWEHGWSYWTRPTAHAVRYNCKYLQKDMGDDLRQGHLAMSKKPPLGALYFQKLADQYVEHGLVPQTLEYTFPDVTRRRKDGTREVVPFRLKERSAELFLERFCDTWQRVRQGQAYPKSDLLADFLDPEGKAERAIRRRHAERDPLPTLGVGGRIEWREEAERLHEANVRKRRASRLDDQSKRRPVKPVRRGPQDLVEWEIEYERLNEDGETKQERRRQQRELQEQTERIVAAVHFRQGEEHAAANARAAANSISGEYFYQEYFYQEPPGNVDPESPFW